MNKKTIAWIVTEAGCHECTSHKSDDNGYPRVRRRGRHERAARLIYEEMFGSIPPGLVVRHACDNTLCINPAHLILGTHADNVADRVRRGRSAIGIRNGRSKLTPEAVRFIRSSTEGTCALARRFGVDDKAIRQVKRWQTWRSVV